jgi:hypothetical protein
MLCVTRTIKIIFKIDYLQHNVEQIKSIQLFSWQLVLCMHFILTHQKYIVTCFTT